MKYTIAWLAGASTFLTTTGIWNYLVFIILFMCHACGVEVMPLLVIFCLNFVASVYTGASASCWTFRTVKSWI